MRKARGASSARDLDAIVDRWPVEQRALAADVRSTVLETIPTAYEVAYPGWKAVGFRDPQAGYFCGLFSTASGLQLVFERGAALPDPDSLFAPPRDLRQVRVCMITSRRVARSQALKAMLRQAVLHGSMR